MTDSRFSEHLDNAVAALRRGRLIFFLGAGANLCDIPGGTWSDERYDRLPLAGELSDHLVSKFGFLDEDKSPDLTRVAQRVILQKGGWEPLYDEIRRIFNADYPLTSLHQWLASIPAILRAGGYPLARDPNTRRLLLVSTNYDDLLERAFTTAGERFTTLIYNAEGGNKGLFLYRSSYGKERFLQPKEQVAELMTDLPIILKFHGGLHRADPTRDSFVIAEDHYIEYLTHTAVEEVLPRPLQSLLKLGHFLFLGHALRDWNVRVLFHRIWKDKGNVDCWAIQHPSSDLDVAFWRQRKVEVLNCALSDYVPRFEERMKSLPGEPRRGGTD